MSSKNNKSSEILKELGDLSDVLWIFDSLLNNHKEESCVFRCLQTREGYPEAYFHERYQEIEEFLIKEWGTPIYRYKDHQHCYYTESSNPLVINNRGYEDNKTIWDRNGIATILEAKSHDARTVLDIWAIVKTKVVVERRIAAEKKAEPYYKDNFIAGTECPYCGKQLRTKNAKQCPHCFKSWRINQINE